MMVTDIYMHIPKCGGSSLRTLFEQNYAPADIMTFAGHLPELLWFMGTDPDFKEKYRLIQGHFPFGIHQDCGDCRYVTLFRDPIERHFSEFKYGLRSSFHPLHDLFTTGKISMEAWATYPEVDPYFENTSTRYFAGPIDILDVATRAQRLKPVTGSDLAVARERLLTFAAFGFADDFSRSVLLIAKALGWTSVAYAVRNVSKETVISSEAREAARQYFQVDGELLRFARAIYEERVHQAGALLEEATAELDEAVARQTHAAPDLKYQEHILGEPSTAWRMPTEMGPQGGAVQKFLSQPSGSGPSGRLPKGRACSDPSGIAKAVSLDIIQNPPADLPPESMMAVIGSKDRQHFINNMALYTGDIIRRCNIHPGASVLDIGSGCGRIALGFCGYLDKSAKYVGFDVWNDGVEWCRNVISAKHSNFCFHSISAKDNYYFDDQRCKVSNDFDLSFLPDQSFDAAFALSVFTHLTRSDAKQYLHMLKRVLKPGGFGYLTFFIIDEHFHRYVEATGYHRGLKEEEPGVWHGYSRNDFFAGFSRERVEEMVAEAGLLIRCADPGSWAQKPNARVYQDFFLVQKGE